MQRRFRVLVMDDEPLVADSLAQILNLSGYEAASVYNPEQAVEHIASSPCDMLITDVVIDGHISGIELAIEFSKLLPLCQVLLMSGSTSTGDLLKSAQERGYSFHVLPKPVHPKEILERLRVLTV